MNRINFVQERGNKKEHKKKKTSYNFPVRAFEAKVCTKVIFSIMYNPSRAQIVQLSP